MKQPAQHLISTMKRRASKIAMGMLKRSRGQFWIKEVIAVAEVPRAAANLDLTVDEVGMHIVLATLSIN